MRSVSYQQRIGERRGIVFGVLLACALGCARPASPDVSRNGESRSVLLPAGSKRAIPASSMPSEQARPVAARRINYPLDRTLSPLTAALSAHLRDIARRSPQRDNHVFAKVGDSVTYSDDFLHCFSGTKIDLGAQPELAVTLEWFLQGKVLGENSFQRRSLSARIGWSAWQVLAGKSPPLVRELEATRARYALVQFGTNDIEIGALHHFADRMLEIVDWLIEHGVVPILSTIMPRRDRAEKARWVPRYNLAIRGVAQSRRVPLFDYYRELRRLPRDGLANDGIHPNTYVVPEGRRPCVFDSQGLRHGFNVRNLWTLRALHEVRRAVGGMRTPDAPVPALRGQGTAEAPYELRRRPGVFVHHFAELPSGRWSTYPCSKRRYPGPEIIYRMDLSKPTRILVMGFDSSEAKADLFLLRERPVPEACVRSGSRVIDVALEPGTYYAVLDTEEGRGETILTVSEE